MEIHTYFPGNTKAFIGCVLKLIDIHDRIDPKHKHPSGMHLIVGIHSL